MNDLMHISTHFHSQRAQRVIVDKYDLADRWRTGQFELIFCIFMLTRSRPDGVETQLIHDLYMDLTGFNYTIRNTRRRLAVLASHGLITCEEENPKVAFWKLTTIGSLVMRGYFNTLKEGVERILDAGLLPEDYTHD